MDARDLIGVARKTDLGEWLKGLRDNPERMGAAPLTDQGAWIEHRAASGLHRCLRCGALAQLAFIADTKAGPRWLDLCPEHASMIYNMATDWR
jgi:hypothetical protein